MRCCREYVKLDSTRIKRGGELDMEDNFSAAKRGLAILGAVCVAACAGYGGSDLKPGASTRPEIVGSMGRPTLAWKNPDGSEQLAYPRGPKSTQTFMVYLGPDGKLQHIEQVLVDAQFHRIRNGMHKDEVLRILGPSGEKWTQFYSRRNELAWSWLFCNSWNVQEFFDVMFDADTGVVRTTGRHPDLRGWREPSCGQ
jgi:hypothetical protein